MTRLLSYHKVEMLARLKNGAVLYGYLQDTIHRYVYFFGVWEPSVTAYYKNTLRRGDVAIDIGANVGAHALLAAQLVGATGRVHAVEASPTIFQRLRRNLDANHAHNVFAYNFAVLDRSQRVQVFLHDGWNLGKTTVKSSEGLKQGYTEEAIVDGRPLSEIVPIADICAARLIKIDVEGAEWLVIKGMRDVLPILARNVDIIVEVTSSTFCDFGVSLKQFVAIFADYGFLPFQIPNSYSPDFYFGTEVSELLPVPRQEFDECQIVFRRTA